MPARGRKIPTQGRAPPIQIRHHIGCLPPNLGKQVSHLYTRPKDVWGNEQGAGCERTQKADLSRHLKLRRPAIGPYRGQAFVGGSKYIIARPIILAVKGRADDSRVSRMRLRFTPALSPAA